jgi:putative hemolysin
MFFPGCTIAPLIRSRGDDPSGDPMPARPPLTQRWIDHLRAPLAGMPSIVPALRAYGGLRVPDRTAVRPADTLGRLGSLEVRLARCAADVRRAQHLRFKVFYREMSAVPDAAALLARRDIDPYDAVCDHLLVVDHAAPGRAGRPAVVGTYRLLRQDMAERHSGFYSAGEFDIASLLARHRGLRFLELGRSCVLPPYRNKRTVELLWHGIWSYVLQHRLDVMIGCASLEGTDPDRLAAPLSFLHHFARAPEAWRTSALPRRYVEMNRMGKTAIDRKAALCALPPLIKGYLRLGAAIGDGAVVDRQFGTTDVLIVLPVSAISTRYIEHFGATAERHAA